MLSIILPYLSNSECINICKDYISKNTIHEYEIVEIVDNTDVYHAYNTGVEKAKYEKVVLINDDMFVSPGWDELFIRHIEPHSVVTSHLIESGRIPVNFRNIEYDCGRTPQDFDYDKFIQYINNNPIPEIIEDSMGWYMPVGFHKSTFVKYPNEIKYPHANDVLLMSDILIKMGYKYKKIGVYLYHLQNFTNKNIN